MILSDFKYLEPENVRFELDDYLKINLGLGLTKKHRLYSGSKEVASLDGDILTIYKGFQWDGCTPKWKIGKFWFGVPDFYSTRIPSCVHDVLCNNLDLDCLGITQEQADDVFYNLLEETGSDLTDLYYTGVNTLGPIYLWLKKLTQSYPNERVWCQVHS